jgi:hypothetical protein
LVQRAIRAVKRHFTAQSEPFVKRRLLVVIRTVEGDLVLQKKRDDHQPGQHYTTEARTLVRSLFTAKSKKFCATSKADDIIHQVFDFRRTGDIYAKPHFERGGIEWHPVLFDISWLLDIETIKEMAKQSKGLESRILEPLETHPFSEKLKRLFPRT